MKLPAVLLSLLVFLPHLAIAQEENTFDLSEIEKAIAKKPYSIGGYLEFRPDFLWLDPDAAFYQLKYYKRSNSSTLHEYNFKFLIDASYEKGIVDFFLRTNTDLKESHLESSDKTTIFEGYASLKPSPLFTVDLGKKTLKWGKGYAWNPAAFVDRPQDPGDPDLALEGFVVASADYIKSLSGPLKAVSLTPVLIPVYENINDDFGEKDNIDFAGKLYLLFYDTDIDLMFLTGGSKTSRFGVDFSRNITPNFEIHGEFAFINDFKQKFIDSGGRIFERTWDAKNYLLGMRYLTRYDTTFICEYYRNETGFTVSEMQDFFAFVDKGHELFRSSGDDALLRTASSLAKRSYGRRNPMRDYFYLRISQKEPFDILYFTPSVTWVFNIDDRSCSLSPELFYTGITNLELRLKAGFNVGQRDTEYGEKRNDHRVEFRVRYYFDATKLIDWIK